MFLSSSFGGSPFGPFAKRRHVDGEAGGGLGGGLLGFLTSRVIQSGTMRGLLSNEAGCGTAPTAHAAANAKSPAAQGVWGIFEVFVDTILLCTVTALVVLVSFDEVQGLGADGVMMTIRAYSTVLGGWAEGFFAVAILSFGYATLICWASYGLECLRFLTSRRVYRYLYFSVFGLAILLGAVAAPESVWTMTDVSVTFLTLLNLSALLRGHSKQNWRMERISCCERRHYRNAILNGIRQHSVNLVVIDGAND
jgi:AGCS family alanine or glycine:cation symporter